jgi:hypothetical protein
MLKRFRNKLKSLSDQDFLDKLIHHDVYPRKYYAAIEQEARTRFFSNRHFNGENDKYIHPATFRPTAIKRRNVVTGAAMVVAAAALAFVLLYSLNTSHLPYLHTTSASRTSSAVSTPSDPSPTGKKIIAVANDDANKEKVIDQPKASRDKPLQWESSYRPLFVTFEKQTIPVATIAIAEETKPTTIDDNQQLAQNRQPEPEPAVPEKTATETTLPPKQEITKPEPKPKKVLPVADETPKAEPAAATAKEPVSDYSNVSQLSVPLLRQFIPFINDWAYQQTQQPGIKDYYVENNSLVNLVLTREYSDSLAVFQQQRATQMMNRYYSALKAKLGEDFPRVQIEIKFLKYNTDL